MEAAGIATGPVFRSVRQHSHVNSEPLSDRAVALVVQGAAAAGLDATNYAGHSPRAGVATVTAEADVAERTIMAPPRHKSLPMMRTHIREDNLLCGNAAASVGL